MENIFYNISQVLGITVLHSLWQGLLVYFLLRVVFSSAPSMSSLKKYNLAIAAMASITVCFFYTLYVQSVSYHWIAAGTGVPAITPNLNLYMNAARFKGGSLNYSVIAGYLPYITIIYLAGLVFNLGKLSWEWNKIYKIKRSILPAVQMHQYINKFSAKLGITKQIRIGFTELVDVPCMIGFLKPLILLPVSLATYLSACEIEAILLHELSHIKRNDYLVNLLQQVITVLLFFNPFAQLINRIINQERENGCDDLVIGVTRNPLIYAKALLKLEETRKESLQLALSATGKKYHLLNRIERIMKTKKPIGNMRNLLVALLILGGSLCSIAWFNPKAVAAKTKTVEHKAVTVPITDQLAAMPVQDSTKKDVRDDKFLHNKVTIIQNDTTKKHKVKIIIEDKNGDKKEYNSFNDVPDSLKGEVSGIDFHFDSLKFGSLNKFYSSPQWKKQMETMQKQFNSPEWKKQMLTMQNNALAMSKRFNGADWKKQMEIMQKQFNGKEWKQGMENMQKQFTSPEWKKSMEDMQKQFSGPEWKQNMENMQKQFTSPEWKKQMEDMQMQFNSPEWKQNMENLQKQFTSPEWKKSMEELQKQFTSPEWKNGEWELDSTKAAKPGKPQIYHKKKTKKG